MSRRSFRRAAAALKGALEAVHQLHSPGRSPEWNGATGYLDVMGQESRALRDGWVEPRVVLRLLLGQLGVGPDSALARSGETLAVEAGKVIAMAHYHNPQHVSEVLVAAYCLGVREGLPPDRVGELLVAAAAHDLDHPGKINEYPFELEAKSFEIARKLLHDDLAAPVLGRLEKMILATDFRNGVIPARQAYRDALAFDPNDERRMMAAQAVLLTEADVTFSCFDLAYNDELSALLAKEWKRDTQQLPTKERIGFVSYVQFVSEAAQSLGMEKRRLRLRGKLESILGAEQG